MRKILLALLIAKFTGVRKDGLEHLAGALALQVKNEDDAKKAIENLNQDEVNEFVKEYRKEVDKEVSKGTKSFEENLKEKYDLVEKGKAPEEKKNEDNPPTDIAGIIAEAVSKAVSPLQEKLEKYEREDLVKSRLQTLTDKLSLCKNDAFKERVLKDFGRMSFDSDEAFNEYLTETETDVANVNQQMAESRLGEYGKPIFSQKEQNGISTNVAKFMESQSSEATSLGGKEV